MEVTTWDTSRPVDPVPVVPKSDQNQAGHGAFDVPPLARDVAPLPPPPANAPASQSPVAVPSVTPALQFVSQRHRWNTNEEIASILLAFERHSEWLSSTPPDLPASGTMFLFNRKETRYRKDSYFWKTRRKGNLIREDHMKLKVKGVERIYGCYVHSAILPTFHRRCYWLLEHPDVVVVHYLNVPCPDDYKVIIPNLANCVHKKNWPIDELLKQLKPMLLSDQENNLLSCVEGAGNCSSSQDLPTTSTSTSTASTSDVLTYDQVAKVLKSITEDKLQNRHITDLGVLLSGSPRCTCTSNCPSCSKSTSSSGADQEYMSVISSQKVPSLFSQSTSTKAEPKVGDEKSSSGVKEEVKAVDNIVDVEERSKEEISTSIGDPPVLSPQQEIPPSPWQKVCSWNQSDLKTSSFADNLKIKPFSISTDAPAGDKQSVHNQVHSMGCTGTVKGSTSQVPLFVQPQLTNPSLSFDRPLQQQHPSVSSTEGVSMSNNCCSVSHVTSTALTCVSSSLYSLTSTTTSSSSSSTYKPHPQPQFSPPFLPPQQPYIISPPTYLGQHQHHHHPTFQSPSSVFPHHSYQHHQASPLFQQNSQQQHNLSSDQSLHFASPLHFYQPAHIIPTSSNSTSMQPPATFSSVSYSGGSVPMLSTASSTKPSPSSVPSSTAGSNNVPITPDDTASLTATPFSHDPCTNPIVNSNTNNTPLYPVNLSDSDCHRSAIFSQHIALPHSRQTESKSYTFGSPDVTCPSSASVPDPSSNLQQQYILMDSQLPASGSINSHEQSGRDWNKCMHDRHLLLRTSSEHVTNVGCDVCSQPSIEHSIATTYTDHRRRSVAELSDSRHSLTSSSNTVTVNNPLDVLSPNLAVAEALDEPADWLDEDSGVQLADLNITEADLEWSPPAVATATGRISGDKVMNDVSFSPADPGLTSVVAGHAPLTPLTHDECMLDLLADLNCENATDSIGDKAYSVAAASNTFFGSLDAEQEHRQQQEQQEQRSHGHLIRIKSSPEMLMTLNQNNAPEIYPVKTTNENCAVVLNKEDNRVGDPVMAHTLGKSPEKLFDNNCFGDESEMTNDILHGPILHDGLLDAKMMSPISICTFEDDLWCDNRNLKAVSTSCGGGPPSFSSTTDRSDIDSELGAGVLSTSTPLPHPGNSQFEEVDVEAINSGLYRLPDFLQQNLNLTALAAEEVQLGLTSHPSASCQPHLDLNNSTSSDFGGLLNDEKLGRTDCTESMELLELHQAAQPDDECETFGRNCDEINLPLLSFDYGVSAGGEHHHPDIDDVLVQSDKELIHSSSTSSSRSATDGIATVSGAATVSVAVSEGAAASSTSVLDPWPDSGPQHTNTKVLLIGPWCSRDVAYSVCFAEEDVPAELIQNGVLSCTTPGTYWIDRVGTRMLTYKSPGGAVG